MKVSKIIALFTLMACAATVQALGINKTAIGGNFGMLNVGKNRPLAVVLTTSIEESLKDVYTPLARQLISRGFSIMSLDVPCHGRDVHTGESPGIDCWASRVKKGDTSFFDAFAGQVDSAIGDAIKTGKVDPNFIVAIGVSRGGYVALRQTAVSRFVKYAVALSPVTDLAMLSEFSGTAVDQSKLGFSSLYRSLASKSIFVQIGNSDDRVGTRSTVELFNGIVASSPELEVNATLMLMPFKGHGVSEDTLALDWMINQWLAKSGKRSKSAP
jgi:hypothetical protein